MKTNMAFSCSFSVLGTDWNACSYVNTVHIGQNEMTSSYLFWDNSTGIN